MSVHAVHGSVPSCVQHKEWEGFGGGVKVFGGNLGLVKDYGNTLFRSKLVLDRALLR